MSRALKVTGNHVLLAVNEEAKTFYFFLFRSMYNKTIVRFAFFDIQNNQGLGKGYHKNIIP